MKSIAIVIVLLLSTVSGFASSVGDFPGSIPLNLSRRPATDLMYKGELLLPDRAYQLHASGIVDISKLNPDSTSRLWSDTYSKRPDDSLDQVSVESGDDVEYLSEVISGSGRFRMSVMKVNSRGVPETFTLMLGQLTHNVLLRKALLRKLGYYVPPTKYIKSINVKIGPATRKIVLNRISLTTAGAASRWVTNSEVEGAENLLLQDVIVMKNDSVWQNLALGYLPEEFIKGRRVLNSLLVAFNLVDVPESVNLYAWHPGRVIDGFVNLPYERSEGFSTPINDAKWIVDRILKLSRKDYVQIAKASFTPASVQKLIVEKMISRRNFYIKYFSIKDVAPLSFDASISDGEFLKNGKLLKQDWAGYGSRFSFGDPDSPLSGSELAAFFKSKFISTIINNLVKYVNTNYIPKTDIQEAFNDHQLEMARDRFINYLKTGKKQDTEFGVWTVPTASGRIIASRDIVIGSYMGADNVVQLADAVGFSVDAGVQMVGFGLPANWNFSGGAKVYFTRTFSHLKPIKSMKKALKEPFNNMIVPLLSRKYGKLFNRITKYSGEQSIQQEVVTEVVNDFKKHLEVGESLIISDSLGAGINLRAGYGFYEKLSAYTRFKLQQNVLSRLHILRSSENEIQIYKDLGNVNKIGVSFGLNDYIPVMTLNLEMQSGTAKVKFYSLSINDDMQVNPEILASVNAIQSLLVSNSMELVDSVKKPYVLKYAFNQKTADFNLFHFRSLKLRIKNQIHLTTPSGFEYTYLRRSDGYRTGLDYQQFANEVIDALIREMTSTDFTVGAPTSGNPGDTIFGKSKYRQTIYDVEIKDGQFKDSFANVTYRWKGWKINRRKAQRIINEITDKYRFEFYPSTIFNETKKLQLYTIDVNINIYENGIRHMAYIDRKSVNAIFEEHFHMNRELLGRKKAAFFRAQKKYIKKLEKGELPAASRYGLAIVDYAEKYLDLQGLLKLVGGEDNMYIYSKIQGFREGDENGDRALISSGIGRFGSAKHAGPLQDVRNELGMTESEFFLNWILKKL